MYSSNEVSKAPVELALFDKTTNFQTTNLLKIFLHWYVPVNFVTFCESCDNSRLIDRFFQGSLLESLVSSQQKLTVAFSKSLKLIK